MSDSLKFWQWIEQSFRAFIDYFSGLFEYYTTDMYTIIKEGSSTLFSWLIDILPNNAIDFFKNTSIFAVMLGSGITVYIVFVVIKFLVGLFT